MTFLNPYVTVFPRFAAEILTGKRTLFHSPLCAPIPKENSLLVLIPYRFFAMGVPAELTSVTKVLLQDMSEEDVVKNGTLSKEEYFESWDKIFPKDPLTPSLEVYRIEFKYLPYSDEHREYILQMLPSSKISG